MYSVQFRSSPFFLFVLFLKYVLFLYSSSDMFFSCPLTVIIIFFMLNDDIFFSFRTMVKSLLQDDFL